MRFKLFFLLIIALLLSFVAYSYTSKMIGGLNDVVEISDKDIAKANDDVNDKGEIVIKDDDFDGLNTEKETTEKSSEEISKLDSDGSKITTMYDGYGNKTETKVFGNDSRLKMVIVRTSADGSKQVFVYGHNGEVKSVPQNMFDKVLKSPSGEIANAAQIYETREDKERRKEELAQRKIDRQRELANNDFPVIRQPGFENNRGNMDSMNEDSEIQTPSTKEAKVQISDNQPTKED